LINDKQAIAKDDTEVLGESTTPGALIDEPSTAFEVQDSTKAKDATNKDDEKMPAIDTDKPSQGAKKEEDIDAKDKDPFQGTTTPITNFPSGLEVIANAAANVDVQLHPVEIIVIDDVPEVHAVSDSSIDALVYSFQGAKELYAPFEETINKTLTAMQGIQENIRSKQRKLLKTYNKSFENSLMQQMPMLHFQNWLLVFNLRMHSCILRRKI
jgi:hypothetical protein